MNKEFDFPQELTVDLAITIIKLRDKFNTNDGQLDDYGLDWWYYHKIAQRAEYWLNRNNIELINTNNEDA